MSDVKGTAATVDVSAAGSTYTALGGVRDVALSDSTGKIDNNDFDVPDWDQHLVGRAMKTLKVTCNYDEADAGQAIVQASANATPKTQIYFRYRPTGSSSGVGKEWILKGTITSMDDTSADGAAAQITFTVESTGAPTYQTQP